MVSKARKEGFEIDPPVTKMEQSKLQAAAHQHFVEDVDVIEGEVEDKRDLEESRGSL